MKGEFTMPCDCCYCDRAIEAAKSIVRNLEIALQDSDDGFINIDAFDEAMEEVKVLDIRCEGCSA